MTAMLWTVILALLGLSLPFAFVRLVRGPSLPDRVIALDFLNVVAVGFIMVYAVRFDQPAFVDVAIILALITFLGTVAFAYYLERRS